MVATLYLFACALATSQSPPASDMPLGPRLVRGQELVFRGMYTEEAKNQGVQFNRIYPLEVRAFVLETTTQGADVALLTMWRGRQTSAMATPTASTARLELVHVDSRGRVAANTPGALGVPLDGPPAVECGAFVEEPAAHIYPDAVWETMEPNRPAHRWRMGGSEVINGKRCVKLVGVQQSDDWEKPRADSAAWRRTDTLWLAPLGYACKVERVIERREPARKDPSQRSVLRYELESSLQYPGQLYDDRKREIQQAQAFADTVAALLPHAGQAGKAFEAVLQRIQDHYDRQPPTPYREAIRHVQRLAEAGKRGEVPPEIPNDPPGPVAQVLALGKRAPDFLVLDLISKESVSLHRWAGKPMVLIFYSPGAASAVEVLRFGQQIGDAHGDQVAILGMAVSDNCDQIMKQREELGIKFPILSGTGLRLSYRVEGTPKFIVLDAAGVARGSYDGWGPEIPRSVHDDLIRCLTAPR